MYYITVVSEKIVATPSLFWIPKAFAWVYFSSEILKKPLLKEGSTK